MDALGLTAIYTRLAELPVFRDAFAPPHLRGHDLLTEQIVPAPTVFAFASAHVLIVQIHFFAAFASTMRGVCDASPLRSDLAEMLEALRVCHAVSQIVYRAVSHFRDRHVSVSIARECETTVIIVDDGLSSQISGIIKNNSKLLDYCRALHAEESAIVNMARLGVSPNLSAATLYTTTYPCNLCANKIAQVGIRTIVYYEPYPQKEAKEILTAHRVKQIPFEGVTYNGYFRFMEVLR